jgi:DNA polymerase V
MSQENQVNVQILQTSICAGTGFPSPAQDYVEVGLNWNEYLIRHPAATFPVRVLGKSMEPLISEGSYVIVDKSLTPKNNDIVVAIYQEEFTLKRFVKNSKGIFLIPENPKFHTISIQKDDDFQIWGVVTFSIQQHRIL